MESLRVTQKQTRTPLNPHHSVQSSLTKATKPALSQKAGILFTGLTTLVAAAVATVAFATDHDPSLNNYQQANTATAHGNTAHTTESSTTTVQSEITIDGTTSPSSSPPTDTQAASVDGVDGTITINDEVLPVTEGTTSRTFVDEQGAIHSVTVTIDNQTYSTESSSSHTEIIVNSDSSSSSGNTTRGSPRR